MSTVVKILAWILASLVALVALLLGALYLIVLVQNWGYADAVFSDAVKYDRVLASRRWHSPFGAEAYDCTWAVVALSNNAEADSPKGRPQSDGPDWWNGVWTATTEDQPEATDLLNACQHRLEPGLFNEMIGALKAPGGWVQTSSETLSVYSKPAGIAYRVRYGD